MQSASRPLRNNINQTTTNNCSNTHQENSRICHTKSKKCTQWLQELRNVLSITIRSNTTTRFHNHRLNSIRYLNTQHLYLRKSARQPSSIRQRRRSPILSKPKCSHQKSYSKSRLSPLRQEKQKSWTVNDLKKRHVRDPLQVHERRN
jgi:hypothetical protein